MNFVDEEVDVQKNSKKNMPNKSIIIASILAFAIFVVIILIAVISSSMKNIKSNELTVSLDGVNSKELKDMLLIDESGIMYMPIRGTAGVFGFKDYNGNYFSKSENADECYLEGKEEIITFVEDANEIVKIKTSNNDVTYYSISKPIKMMKNQLYIVLDGFEKIYNANADFDKNNNQLIIETMDFIIEKNKEKIIRDKITNISTRFEDRKAALDGMVIVTNDSGRFGLYNIDQEKIILETKYDNIEYVPITKDFIVKSNGVVGVVTKEGREKIKIRYENIEYVGQDYKLYVVKKDSKYGIVDASDNEIIPIIYDRIGIDISNYVKNNIKNKYVFLNNLIPVMKDREWGFFDTNGTQVADFKYESIGCLNSKGENLLIIPTYQILVVSNNKKYIMIDKNGKEVWNGMEFEQIYLKFQNGEASYWFVRNGKTYDAIQYLGKTYNNSNSENTNSNSENNSNENNNSSENNDNNDNNNSNNNSNNNNNNSNNNNNNNSEEVEVVNHLRNNNENSNNQENNENNSEDNNNEESEENSEENNEENNTEENEENEENQENEENDDNDDNDNNDNNDEENSEDNSENEENNNGNNANTNNRSQSNRNSNQNQSSNSSNNWRMGCLKDNEPKRK